MSATEGLVLLVTGAFLVGGATGSFAGVLIERLPERRTIGGRSLCACGRQLTWWENLPVASWLLLRGRARCCDAPIPAWYLGIEAGFGAVGAGAVLLPVPLPVSAVIAVAVWAGAIMLAVRKRRVGTP